MRLTEVGIELALAAALYSARSGLPIPGATAIAGELSLAGEARPVPRLKQRAKTCASMGYLRFVGPKRRQDKEGEAWTEVASIKEAIVALFGKGPIATRGTGPGTDRDTP
jgi:DNA repair protein RadA/Sms